MSAINLDNMTRSQAIDLSSKMGYNITHPYFTDEEYIRISPVGTLIDEKGHELNAAEFWSLRTTSDWQTRWSVHLSSDIEE